MKENAMKHRRRRFLYFAATVALLPVALALALPADPAWAQAARTIKIVVPVAPGGPSDTLARLLAEQIGKAHGVTVLIENRPGAGSVIGTEAVARAAPDGNTVLLATPGLVLSPHLHKLNFDPLTAFKPICQLVDDPSLIVVNAASPYRSFADLVAAARAKPGDVTMASVGPGTPPQFALETLKHTANLNITFVPYLGYAPSVNALLGGHVTSILVDYSAAIEHLKAGTLRAIATAARTRLEQLPDLPTMGEAGFPDLQLDIWFGLTAPANTPKETVAELTQWFTAALKVGEVRAKLLTQGLIPVALCGADFAAFIRQQYDGYGRLVRESRVRTE